MGPAMEKSAASSSSNVRWPFYLTKGFLVFCFFALVARRFDPAGRHPTRDHPDILQEEEQFEDEEPDEFQRRLAGPPADDGHDDGNSTGHHDDELHFNNGGEYTRWYFGQVESWEIDVINAMFTAFFVGVTLLFQRTYTYWERWASEQYVYGVKGLSRVQKDALRKGKFLGEPVQLTFMKNLAGRFMALGFLAFGNWCFYEIYLWHSMGSFRFPGLHLPVGYYAGGVYLDIGGTAHFRIFLGFCLYYAFCFRLTTDGERQMRATEISRNAWREQVAHDPGHGAFNKNEKDQLCFFKITMKYFCTQEAYEIMRWRVSAPEDFKRVLQSLGIHKKPEQVTFKEMRDNFTSKFSFSTFSAMVVRDTVEEFMDFSGIVTFIMICVFFVLAVVMYFGTFRYAFVAPFFSFLLTGTLYYLYTVLQQVLRFFFRDGIDPKGNVRGDPRVIQERVVFKWFPDVPPHVVLRNTLQPLIFAACWSFPAFLFNSTFDNLDAVLLVLNAGCLMAAYFVVPRIIIWFTMISNCPPFATQEAQEQVKAVLRAGVEVPTLDDVNVEQLLDQGELGVAVSLKWLAHEVTSEVRSEAHKVGAGHAHALVPGVASVSTAMTGRSRFHNAHLAVHVQGLCADDLFEGNVRKEKMKVATDDDGDSDPDDHRDQQVADQIRELHSALKLEFEKSGRVQEVEIKVSKTKDVSGLVATNIPKSDDVAVDVDAGMGGNNASAAV